MKPVLEKIGNGKVYNLKIDIHGESINPHIQADKMQHISERTETKIIERTHAAMAKDMAKEIDAIRHQRQLQDELVFNLPDETI